MLFISLEGILYIGFLWEDRSKTSCRRHIASEQKYST